MWGWFVRSAASRWAGVYRVGIVRRHHEAGGQGGEIVLVAAAQGFVDALQGVQQHGARRALLRAAAHLFIVEHGVNGGGVRMAALQEALEVCIGTLQIV